MFRFSLTTFFLAIVVVSLVVAGLASPNLIWVQIVGTMTLVAILIASVAGIVGEPDPFDLGSLYEYRDGGDQEQ